ncbi:MAG: single-strand DNA-binding protein [Anaerolineaceae bacterium]|nr:MAG: single-strand DNA-binding protein [Anaerolineaceae bacterium]
MTYHTVILAGNLGRDPEMRYTPDGKAVTNFSIAVNDDYTNNNGERVKRTIWVRVSAWGKQAESCNQYLKKGSKALVEGRLTADAATGGPRVWTGQDGQPRASFEISANTVRFLSSRSDADAGGAGAAPAAAGDESMAAPVEEENIPF